MVRSCSHDQPPRTDRSPCGQAHRRTPAAHFALSERADQVPHNHALHRASRERARMHASSTAASPAARTRGSSAPRPAWPAAAGWRRRRAARRGARTAAPCSAAPACPPAAARALRTQQQATPRRRQRGGSKRTTHAHGWAKQHDQHSGRAGLKQTGGRGARSTCRRHRRRLTRVSVPVGDPVHAGRQRAGRLEQVEHVRQRAHVQPRPHAPAPHLRREAPRAHSRPSRASRSKHAHEWHVMAATTATQTHLDELCVFALELVPA